MTLYEFIIGWTLISFFLTIACMSDGPESFENVPTTWLIMVACVPGFIIILGLTLGFLILASPFLLLNFLWQQR